MATMDLGKRGLASLPLTLYWGPVKDEDMEVPLRKSQVQLGC